MIRVFRLKFVLIAIIFLLAFCNRNDVSNSCNNLPFFCSLKINGEVICYENCIASFSNTSTSTKSKITAGNTINSEDEIILKPEFTVLIPSIKTGTWNKDSIKGFDFIAFSNFNGGNYVFPAFKEPFYQTLISDFNITISLYDTINKKVEGFFSGILVDNTKLDSIIIENGKFISYIME